jgi:hypothetical protein
LLSQEGRSMIQSAVTHCSRQLAVGSSFSRKYKLQDSAAGDLDFERGLKDIRWFSWRE